jgi:prolyl 4-hydroxylase
MAAFTIIKPNQPEVPDRAALKRIGEQVHKRLAGNPAIYTLPTDKAEILAMGDFMSPSECRKMIAMIDQVARPSSTFDVSYGEEYRTSYSGDVDPHDPFVRKISRRIDDLLGLDPSWGETIQGQRYLPGQKFGPHCDWFFTEARYWPREAENGGQRSWTTMVYLNEVEEGGATDFPELGLSVAPKSGAILMWNNADRQGVPNRWTIHSGTEVKAGVKYIITKWYRTRKWG